MKLCSNETELFGKWIEEKGQIHADAVCERIRWLTSHHLNKIIVSKESGGWEALFQDPDDGRFWEQIYSQGGLHGGGPPALKCLSKEDVWAKYHVKT